MGVVEVVEVRPLEESIEPALAFNLKVRHEKWLRSVVAVDGSLLSEEGKVLVKLSELRELKGAHEVLGEIGARGTIQDKEFMELVEHEISIGAILSGRVLDYIEDVRSRNPKGDVVLKLKLRARLLTSRCSVAHFYDKNPQGYGLQRVEGENLVVYRYNPDFAPPRANLWVLSGSGGPVFLAVEDFIEEHKKVIPSSDWIHDFAPKLGLGKFMVVEIPRPVPVTVKDELARRVNAATKALQSMEEKLISGEWVEVVKEARPVMELLRRVDLIKDLLIKCGYTDEATGALINGIKELFNFSSKFIHKVDEKGIKLLPEIKAEKEDAYFIYTLSAGLINLIARKTLKLKG